jgi:hypothetical protein
VCRTCGARGPAARTAANRRRGICRCSGCAPALRADCRSERAGAWECAHSGGAAAARGSGGVRARAVPHRAPDGGADPELPARLHRVAAGAVYAALPRGIQMQLRRIQNCDEVPGRLLLPVRQRRTGQLRGVHVRRERQAPTSGSPGAVPRPRRPLPAWETRPPLD